MIFLKHMALIISAVALAGCATVTISPNGQIKTTAQPNYSERQNFFLWGLTPSNNEVNVARVCNNSIQQMSTTLTATDLLFVAVTLGVYAPRTVKVWCNE